MPRYIILSKETLEPDWDGLTHASVEKALESLCGGDSIYVRTRDEAAVVDDQMRVYWADDYEIHEVKRAEVPVRAGKCGHDGGMGIGAGHTCVCVGLEGHDPFYGVGHGCSCGALWRDK